MIGAFNQNKFLRLWQRREESLELLSWAKRIARTTDQQFGLGAILQEFKFVNARLFPVGGHWYRRNAHANQRLHPRIGTCGAQSNRRAERKSRKQQWQVKLRIQPVESGSDIFDFPVAVIVLSVAQSGAAEVEAQHGKAKTIQRLHGVKDDLVMQRPAEQRMRMANYRRMSCVFRAGVEQGFQSSCRTFEEEGSDD